ncbi:MAG: ABC transporter permease [Ginsengibacter sp.]
MFRYYLRVALRNLWKNKAFSAINIVGLAAGLAVCLLIVLYVFDELSYDKYNENADRIYRVDADIYFNGTQFTSAETPAPLAVTLVKDYPRVEQMVRINFRQDIRIKKGNSNIQDHNVAFADSTFFRVFTANIIAGDPLTALNEPNSIVIDETAAKRYFNTTDVVGKALFVDNVSNCKITAVIKDIPRTSHFHFSFIRPFRDLYANDANEWLSNNYKSYILVRPGTTQAMLQGYIDATINKYLMKQMESQFHATAKDLAKAGNHFFYPAIPLTDIHLHSDKSFEFEANGNMTYVYIFSVIAILILLIACVNFMNLSTARSANRAKEVGIRKVAGSLRSHLIIQFLTESVLLSFFALLLALGLSALLLPFFNQLAGKHMYVSTLFTTWLLPVLVALVIIVGCIAGSYPALYLSSFQPIQVLKGRIASGFKGSWLRCSLVVFQFCISIILIIGTVVIYNQLDYIRTRKIGYNREQVLVLHNTYTLDNKIRSFREELLKIAGIEKATITSNLPTGGGFNQNAWFRDATLDAKRVVVLTNFKIDENYIPTLGMHVATGRNFSQEFASDSTGILLNETAVQLFGFKDPLAAVLYRPDDNGKPMTFHIIGVVKDFNYNSMHEKVGPLVIEYGPYSGNIALQINTKNISSLISQVENKWNSMSPGQPFSYTFMDNDFDHLYNADQRTSKLFMTFAVFAIFIACLGLFGLVTYAAEQRTKEIGIRKVLGAGISGIVAMLLKDFAKLIMIASLISFPVAWWMMNKWLQSFAYRIGISWWVFILAAVFAIVIALITVSFQAIKAAIANPVNSLRSE